MTLLIISPDYASHLYPLAAMGRSWQERGERVVVATGPATASIVEEFGYEHLELVLGKGSNPGTIRVEDQPAGEDDLLDGFFQATRNGMVATLMYQARARLHDLMYEPVNAARRVLEIIGQVEPDQILVDHLAFSARVGLHAAGIDYIDAVLGHPSALPLAEAGEVYGYPTAWPTSFTPGEVELEELADLCARVSENFTEEWNRAVVELSPDIGATLSASLVQPRLSENAFSERGRTLVHNYPRELMSADRLRFMPECVFVGASIRDLPGSADVDEWIQSSDAPFVYVSFGSFLSARGDVLKVVVEALRTSGVRAAIAHGSTPVSDLGTLPPDWLVAEFLPQVTLLKHAAAAVSHGGNNSVTEALAFGVPLVVLPFSTDQFAGAAALEQSNLGTVLPPNTATSAELARAIATALDMPAESRELLDALRREQRTSVDLHELTSEHR